MITNRFLDWQCRGFFLAGVVGVAMLAARPPVQAQQDKPNVIVDGPTCPACRLTLSPPVILGDPGDSVVSEWPTSVRMQKNGRIIATFPNKHDPPAVFDSKGRFRQRLGRKGPGPGEFEAAAELAVDPNDTVFVSDRTGRLSVFSPGLQFVRSVVMPFSVRGMVAVGPSDLVINATIRDRESVGMPFHLLDHSGRKVGAIGDRTRSYLQDGGRRSLHRLAAAQAGGFWAAPVFGNYRLERWTAAGRREAYLQRVARWFVPMPDHVSETMDPVILDPPVSTIDGVWEDVRGLIWVVARTRDSRGPGPTETIRTPEGPAKVEANIDLSWDSVVEVIDPERAVVVASQRFDQLLVAAVGGGYVLHVREQKDGGIRLEVLRLTLAGFPKPQRR